MPDDMIIYGLHMTYQHSSLYDMFPFQATAKSQHLGSLYLFQVY
jgi:hypothetical protein